MTKQTKFKIILLAVLVVIFAVVAIVQYPKLKPLQMGDEKIAGYLVIDLDNDGMSIVGKQNPPAMFDFENTRIRKGTSWVGGEDGFLVFDRNNDGTINHGGELFGTQTDMYDGSGKARNAFEALRNEDSNGDGKVDEKDANWERLMIWRDLNKDGISQPDELFTLAELNITGFKVDAKPIYADYKSAAMFGEGVYYRNGSGSGPIYHADFMPYNFYREFMDKVEVPDYFLGTPNVGGTGLLRDLREAMAWEANGGSLETPPEGPDKDTPLQRAVNAFSAADTRAEQRDLLHELLYAWANTSGMAKTMQERFDGVYTVKYVGAQPPDGDWEAWDRKLHVLEAVHGEYFAPAYQGGPQVVDNNVPGELPIYEFPWANKHFESLNKSYEQFYEGYYYELARQTRLSLLFDHIDSDFDDEGNLDVDLSSLTAYFEERIANDPINGFSDLYDFCHVYSEELSEFGWDCNEKLRYYMEVLGDAPEYLELYRELGLETGGADTPLPTEAASGD